MITKELFNKLFPTKGLSPGKYNLVRMRDELIDALNEFLPRYEINDHRRVSAFLATCGVETDYFKVSTEYASGADYEGRKDLGNTQKGDGKKFRGRGIIQTTGRFNYSRVQKRVGKKLGVDLLAHPEKLAEIRIAVESACIFWQENGLNLYADRKEFKELNGIVNRGDAKKTPLHWAKRNELYSKCIRYIPQNFRFARDEENSDRDFQTLPVANNANFDTAGDTEPAQTAQGFNFDFSKASANYSRATATLQNPSVKAVGKKAGLKLLGGLSAVWGTTSGKIALVLTALVLIAVAAGVIYSYRKPIQLGWQLLKISIYELVKGGARG